MILLFLLSGQPLDDLQLVAILCPDLMPGNAFLLLLMDDGPARLVTEGVAGFPLHGDVGLVFVVVVHLFVGGDTVQSLSIQISRCAASAVFRIPSSGRYCKDAAARRYIADEGCQ